MKKFEISNEEKNRILSLHENATKRQYLKEQDSSYGNCDNSNEIEESRGRVNRFNKNDIENIIMEFSIEAYFNSSNTSTTYKNVLNDLKKSIRGNFLNKFPKDEYGPDFVKSYEFTFIQVESVIGSASNYLDGALKPTHDNKGNKLSEDLLNQPPYNNLPGAGTDEWDKNMGYAQGRWSGLVEYIQTYGKEFDFKINSDVTVSPTAIITDTGGCIDEKRDTTNYINSGQYVKLTGKIGATRKVDTPVDITECAEGLTVIIGYFKNSQEVNGVKMKSRTDRHQCNYATFDILLNGEKIGVSNMNNAFGKQTVIDPNTGERKIWDHDITWNDPKARIGMDEPGYNKPNERGGNVYTIFNVDTETLQRISTASENGEVVIEMVGNSEALMSDNKMHTDAPVVYAYSEDKDTGEITPFFDGPFEPYLENAGTGFAIPTKKTLATFRPCESVSG